MDGGIFFDLSGFVANPIRAGIQRVSYQILKNWTFDPPLVPGFIEPGTGRAVILPDVFGELIRRFFNGGAKYGGAAAEEIVACAREAGRVVDESELGRFSRYLNPEIFHEAARIAFYLRLAEHKADRIHFFVHDAMPALHPDFFPPGTATVAMPYLRTLRAVGNIHFNSIACKRDYCERIFRDERATYHVCSLGADGLGTARPEFSPSNTRFSCLGTVEPRKNHALILEAFKRLWARGTNVELVFIGKLGWGRSQLGWEARDVSDELTALGNRVPQFRWCDGLDDRQAKEMITSSRGTVYASETEGFGLPPLESLALGVPVIVSGRIPSIEMIPHLGQIRLAAVSAATICTAVTSMMNDSVAARKHSEILQLELPTWKKMAQSLHQTMTAG
jgi:glycosyltransferase involved in cell wall biosynthesis